jgi:hypothetical protein
MSTLRVEALEQPDGTAFVFNNKNLLINGGMNIFQRSTSASVSTDTYSTVDRWKTRVGNQGAFTVSRSTDVPSAQGFGYSTKWDCTTADASPAAGDFIIFEQRIEGQNLQHLLKGTSSAKKLTLSFWVKSNKTGTYIIELRDEDNTRHICQSYTISSASTWEKKELTFDGDTTGTLDNDNAESLRVIWWLAAGSDTNSGTLATSWASRVEANRAVGQVNLADSTSNEWYMTGCQLEVGSTASGFEFEPFATTLRKCHRYYRRWARISTEPEYVQSVYFGCFAQFFSTTQAIVHPIGLYAPFRDTPDVAYSGVTDFTIIDNGNVTEYSSAAPTVYTSGSVVNSVNPSFVFTTSSATNGRVGRVFNRYGTSWIAMDAEL